MEKNGLYKHWNKEATWRNLRLALIATFLVLASYSSKLEAQTAQQGGIVAAESVKKARQARAEEMNANDGSATGSGTSNIKKVWDAEKGRYVFQEKLYGKHAAGALRNQELEDMDRQDPDPQKPPEEENAETRRREYFAKRKDYSGYPIQPSEDKVVEQRGKLGGKQ